MCGIGGVLMFPKERSAAELSFIRALAINIAVENEIRGSDATGFVTFSNNVHSLLKQPIRAEALVQTQAFKTFIGRAINRNTKNILIHTRMGTKGSEENNLNNHPIESHRFIGVHNGVIYNDDELFAQHKMFRAAQVDSEVIFRLLDTQGDKLESSSLVWVAEQLAGAFTTAFVPKKDKNRMFLIRNDNPVTLFYMPSLNIIAFASMERFVVDAVADANKMFPTIAIRLEEMFKVEPKRQTIYSFDTNADNALEQLQQVPLSFTENYGAWFGTRGRGVYGYEDEYAFFGTGAGEDAPTVKNHTENPLVATSEISDILTKLSDTDLARLATFLTTLESNSWSEGWSKGRESLDEEMKHKVVLGYEEGYEKGYDEGYAEARSIRV